MKQKELVLNQKSILFESWEDRDLRLNEIFEKDPTYNDAVEKCQNIFNELTEILKDIGKQQLALDYDSAWSCQFARAQDLSYKQGHKDGVRAIIESLQST